MHYHDVSLALLEGVQPVFLLAGSDYLHFTSVVLRESLRQLVVEACFKTVFAVHIVAKVYYTDNFLSGKYIFIMCSAHRLSSFKHRGRENNRNCYERLSESSFYFSTNFHLNTTLLSPDR